MVIPPPKKFHIFLPDTKRSHHADKTKTPEVVREYLKALVLTGRIEGADLSAIVPQGEAP